jgi:CHAT domain-containing protein
LTLALEATLKSKGIVLEALADERSKAVCSNDDQLLEILDRHTKICSEISGIALAAQQGGQQSTPKKTRLLYQLKDSLETEMSSQCADIESLFGAPNITVEAVAAQLPTGAVLVEYLRFSSFDFGKSTDAHQGAKKYFAFLLTASGEVSLLDLGDAEYIDSLAMDCQIELQTAATVIYTVDERTAERRLANITSELYKTIFQPIEELISEQAHLIVSPDGALNLIPFEILSRVNDRYLIEDYQFTYVSSGRDLLDRPVNLDNTLEKAVIVVNPDYEHQVEISNNQIFAGVFSNDSRSRGPSDGSGCLNDVYQSLPQTRIEGETIRSLISGSSALEVDYFTSENASEGALKNLGYSPKILHIATHGFYCPKIESIFDGELLDNPLLYSGLVLSGANKFFGDSSRANSNSDDGILTSLEAAGLNLVGTELVVLSACGTGLGSIQSGEGVFGLRRSFRQAGASSLLMSMYPVPDAATKDLMIDFYENWLSRNDKSSALRTAALAALQNRRLKSGVAHPRFWGGFVFVGNPN